MFIKTLKINILDKPFRIIISEIKTIIINIRKCPKIKKQKVILVRVS